MNMEALQDELIRAKHEGNPVVEVNASECTWGSIVNSTLCLDRLPRDPVFTEVPVIFDNSLHHGVMHLVYKTGGLAKIDLNQTEKRP